ncbi:RrF2 family transcriptional regulator [Paracoccus albus]|uniref:RrF2 family transcriptional regulator n=1 Tax=Paracoccus albus TaxID=3017784 RepID=UPI0022EFEB87|nr:Rrf2 family transcriptional regulator [Paracoccus albus]WBU60392.1 Rrf2 family transcriptional regulator [Paracoccus albus]
MRLTVRTNLAMRVLMYCAIRSGDLVRSADMAEAINASTHHVAQVVNRLSALGYLETLRGRTGGVKLLRDPRTITVGDVFVQFESGVPLTECFDEAGNTCPLLAGCRLRDALIAAVSAFYASLEGVTLHDLVRNNHELQNLFAGHGCHTVEQECAMISA